mmetsp:Transcript_63441/g.179046  ORF Transcript_63441/g.179046 Transcript_63441/m.179046 type:complete len:216 (-) Transcript_63441:166-813(-)
MSVTPTCLNLSMLFPMTPYQSPAPARQLSQLKPCNNTMLSLFAVPITSSIFSRRLPLGMRLCMMFNESRSNFSTSSVYFLVSSSSWLSSMSIILGTRLMSELSTPSLLMHMCRLERRCMRSAMVWDWFRLAFLIRFELEALLRGPRPSPDSSTDSSTKAPRPKLTPVSSLGIIESTTFFGSSPFFASSGAGAGAGVGAGGRPWPPPTVAPSIFVR